MHRLALLTLGALAASLEYGVQASAAPQVRRGTTVTAAFGVANSSPARSKAGRPRKSEYPPVVAPHSQTCAPVRLYEEIPAFPDSPSALVDSMVSSIVEGLCCEAADRRLRVELQGLRLLSGVSDEWRAAVGGPAGRLPLYEQVRLSTCWWVLGWPGGIVSDLLVGCVVGPCSSCSPCGAAATSGCWLCSTRSLRPPSSQKGESSATGRAWLCV